MLLGVGGCWGTGHRGVSFSSLLLDAWVWIQLYALGWGNSRLRSRAVMSACVTVWHGYMGVLSLLTCHKVALWLMGVWSAGDGGLHLLIWVGFSLHNKDYGAFTCVKWYTYE